MNRNYKGISGEECSDKMVERLWKNIMNYSITPVDRRVYIQNMVAMGGIYDEVARKIIEAIITQKPLLAAAEFDGLSNALTAEIFTLMKYNKLVHADRTVGLLPGERVYRMALGATIQDISHQAFGRSVRGLEVVHPHFVHTLRQMQDMMWKRAVGTPHPLDRELAGQTILVRMDHMIAAAGDSLRALQNKNLLTSAWTYTLAIRNYRATIDSLMYQEPFDIITMSEAEEKIQPAVEHLSIICEDIDYELKRVWE